MDKWKVKTDCLKGFEVGDIVTKVKNNERAKLICVVDTVYQVLYFDADLIELKPDWFEKIEEDIYVYGVCNPLDSNKSWLYTYLPPKGFVADHFQSAIFKQTGLFSSKIQKYKLVPVNDDD